MGGNDLAKVVQLARMLEKDVARSSINFYDFILLMTREGSTSSQDEAQVFVACNTYESH